MKGFLDFYLFICSFVDVATVAPAGGEDAIYMASYAISVNMMSLKHLSTCWIVVPVLFIPSTGRGVSPPKWLLTGSVSGPNSY